MSRINKIIIFLIIVLFCFLSVNYIFFDNPGNRHPFNANHLIGDAFGNDVPYKPNTGQVIQYDDPPGPHVYNNDAISFTITEVSPLARTKYDLQSNGCIHYIQQDPIDKRKLHACWMHDDVFAVGFPDRRTQYFYSNDTGTTWTLLSNVPVVRSGFPAITLLSNGIPVIANHSTDGGGGMRTQLYNDASIGGGSFNRLDPGGINRVWPALISTQSITLTNKIVFITSVDSAFRNVCTGITGTGSFLGYIYVPQMHSANSYALARGSDGRIGCAFESKPPLPDGCVYFMESTDNGSTFSTPQQIYAPNYSTDSLANFRGLDITYKGTTPVIVFGVTVWDPTASGYYPNRPGKMYSWSPGVNGGNPVTIATHPGLTGIRQSFLDGFTPICRPTIGISGNGDAVYCVYNAGNPDTNAAGDNYFDVYFSWSIAASIWSVPVRLTNLSTTRRDCRYVSISDYNHIIPSSEGHFAHIIFQSDSIPGSAVNGAQISLAKMMYAKIYVPPPLPGIHGLGNEIPNQFHLYQNYPNPFNPSTKIKFDIPYNKSEIRNPKSEIIIYDILGREITKLVNETLKPGTYEVDWDASDYPSGIYYYRLTYGSYSETSKMVLLK